VKNSRKIFDVGSLHLIRGRITIYPVDRDTPGRQCGLLEAVPSQIGNRPDRVPFCGFMGNVSPPTPTLLYVLIVFLPGSGGQEKVFSGELILPYYVPES
jgi:hypothetical protein